MRNPTKHSPGIAVAMTAGLVVTGCSAGTSSTTSSAARTASSSMRPSSNTPATSQWPTIAPRAPGPGSTSRPAITSQPPHPAPASPVRARVKAFVTAVVTTKGLSRASWTTKVCTFVDADLARQLALTDPVNIPAQKVTGQPQLLYTGTTEAVSGWFVPTSTSGYTVTMSQGGGQLQITAVVPGRSAPTTDVPTDNE